MGTAKPSDPDPPQTDEVPISDELTVYAVVAGIALSHNSIPLVGVSNPLNRIMVLLSVCLIIAILFVHIDNRFDTKAISLSIARTLTVILTVYLMGSGINGLSSNTQISLSGNYQSVVTLLIFVMIFLISLFQRFKISGLDDLKVGKHYESEGKWTLKGKIKANLIKGTIVSAPFIYLAIRDPVVFAIPAICGFISALTVSAIWGNIFFRAEHLEDIEDKKAKVVIVWPCCLAVFIFLFT